MGLCCPPAATFTKLFMAGKQVLVVDDEEVVRQLIEEMLHRLGHFVQTAASGAEALSKIEGTGFDLVITDLNLGGMNGDELALEIRKRRPKLPIVLATGYRLQNEPTKFAGVLFKPFSLDEFRFVVAKALGPAE
jgi:CheY-like chemotaxis protein